MESVKKKIGIIGGGQLGKMMILDAKRLGFHITTLDPTPLCPSHSISDEHIVAGFNDQDAIRRLASQVDVITYEFEHIDSHILSVLEEEGHQVYPTAKSLQVIQNKYTQKQLLKDNQINVPKFIEVKTIEDIKQSAEILNYPLMLKTCTGGYDGKGNALIKSIDDVEAKFESLGAGKLSLMVEEYIPFVKEVSVLACRGLDGQIVVYPVAENVHVNSILDETLVPAALSDSCTHKAMEMAHDVMELFDGIGMFCTEMFITADESVYLNEVAPRPHNSGHYTIEGCLTSQFEQHIRAITGLPLGNVELRSPIAMRNILGEPGYDGSTKVVGLENAYHIDTLKVHLYGKETTKGYRKMGHLTVVGHTLEEAKMKAKQAQDLIKIICE